MIRIIYCRIRCFCLSTQKQNSRLKCSNKQIAPHHDNCQKYTVCYEERKVIIIGTPRECFCKWKDFNMIIFLAKWFLRMLEIAFEGLKFFTNFQVKTKNKTKNKTNKQTNLANQLFQLQPSIYISKRTEWSPIQSVIIRVITLHYINH